MEMEKVVGPDGIPAEVWKCLGEKDIDILWNLIAKKENQINVLIVRRSVGNYKGVKLISHTTNIYDRIIEGRLRMKTTICEEQFGFMPGKSTVDAIFALRQTVEKYREKQTELQLMFIDLEKADNQASKKHCWNYRDVKGESLFLPWSAVSPYVFDIVMDVITPAIREEVPWCSMFADGIMLTDLTRRCSTQERKMKRRT
ncbi:uncharacterized protein [Palaemon carinicauda]|uniref:uncharacterized protein n=1 Tax=Palaemon carinicauda TaxID=392227 RepID=UPI0035B65B66